MAHNMILELMLVSLFALICTTQHTTAHKMNCRWISSAILIHIYEQSISFCVFRFSVLWRQSSSAPTQHKQ